MARRHPFAHDAQAVTAVVGSILILAITVMGIAAVMYWGAPSIQRIQDRNAQAAVLGEFEDLRVNGEALSVPDTTRTPKINIPGGTLGIETGTRFLVTVNHDPAHTGCDLHVRDWNTAPLDTLTVSSVGCAATLYDSSTCPASPLAGTACVEIQSVSGNNLVKQVNSAGAGTYTVSGADFSSGDWVVRLTNNATPVPTVYAEAWMMSSVMHAWDLPSSLTSRFVYHDGGALFSRQDDTWFLESSLPLQEDAFGSGDYVLWLRTFTTPSADSFSGPTSVTVVLSQLGTYTRVDNATVYSIRYDFTGLLAEAWCNALVARSTTAGTYAADATYTCTADVPSVVFTPTSAPIDMEFLNARIRTTLRT